MRSIPALISELVLIALSNSSFMFLLNLLGTADGPWMVFWKYQKKKSGYIINVNIWDVMNINTRN